MRSLIVAGLFAATAALGAQSQLSRPSSSTPQQPADQQSSTARDMPVTVDGCLTASSGQKTFMLVAQPSVDLRSHVSHTVEVTGRQPQVSTTANAEIVARQLNVTSVKDLAADCRAAK